MRWNFFFASMLLSSLLGSWATPDRASAQVELTGTYVRYMAIGASGTMLCSTCGGGNHSMQYAEATTDTPSCDAFFPGSPVEGFTVEGTVGGRTTLVTNSGPFGGSFTTSSGPTLTGRSITWSGTASLGGTTIRIDQTHSYEMDDRFVRVTLVVNNTGTMPITDLYYLRNADPDHGSCSIGFDTSTGNDVRRQPPGDDSALVTTSGGDGTSPSRTAVIGIGAHDPRARVHTGGFSNTDASGEWNRPEDHEGRLADEGVDIVFKEAMLAAGASTTFEFFYVWGRTVADVEMRFDEVGFPAAPCMGLMEGAACTARGIAGLCRGGRCCTGCWNGTRCQIGTSSSACGAGGAMCSSCDDRMFCTLDSCAAGRCSSAASPTICNDDMSCTSDACNEATDSCTFTFVGGCIIGGMCVGAGTTNPTYPCQVCDPDTSMTDWTTMAEGTACGSGPLCVVGRLREGMCAADGRCVLSTVERCPTGACADESTCAPPCDASTCEEGEWCNPTLMRCERIGTVGDRCSAPMGCDNGICIDGFCCDTECEGTCESCGLERLEGTCTPFDEGTDPDDECATECDGAGMCLPGGDAGVPDAGAADAGAPDGGTDAGSIADGGPPIDAGAPPPPPDDGCGCGAGSANSTAIFGLMAVVALATRARRRRR
jgi:hypothetical protein